MKHVFIVLISLFLSAFSTAETLPYAGEQSKVIVVMSSGSYAYHKTRDCSAVRRAKHPVKEVTLDEAKKMGRKPCRICY